MEQAQPDWLPDLVSVDGDWNEILPGLYHIFENDLIKHPKILCRMPVWWERKVREEMGYPEGFLHLIERENYETDERLFDPRRAERLPWFGSMIGNIGDVGIKVWCWLTAKGKIRVYVWLEHFDYVAVFEKKSMRIGEVAFIITAFYIDGDSKRRDLQRKYTERIPDDKCKCRPVEDKTA